MTRRTTSTSDSALRLHGHACRTAARAARPVRAVGASTQVRRLRGHGSCLYACNTGYLDCNAATRLRPRRVRVRRRPARRARRAAEHARAPSAQQRPDARATTLLRLRRARARSTRSSRPDACTAYTGNPRLRDTRRVHGLGRRRYGRLSSCAGRPPPRATASAGSTGPERRQGHHRPGASTSATASARAAPGGGITTDLTTSEPCLPRRQRSSGSFQPAAFRPTGSHQRAWRRMIMWGQAVRPLPECRTNGLGF